MPMNLCHLGLLQTLAANVISNALLQSRHHGVERELGWCLVAGCFVGWLFDACGCCAGSHVPEANTWLGKKTKSKVKGSSCQSGARRRLWKKVKSKRLTFVWKQVIPIVICPSAVELFLSTALAMGDTASKAVCMHDCVLC